MYLIEAEYTIPKGSEASGSTEYWTKEDWEKHKANVDKLKAEGEYGMMQTIKVSVVHNELFDGPIEDVKRSIAENPLSTMRVVEI